MSDAYTPADANMTSEGGSAVEAPPPEDPANPSGLSPEELERLQREDQPIESDPVGNAIPGMLVGGVEGLVEGGVHLVGAAIGEAGVAIAEHFGDSSSAAGSGAGSGSGSGETGPSAGGDGGSGSE
jgi:hypothetical protein